METADVEICRNSNPPLIPLFSKGEIARGVLTPLWKRGEGEICEKTFDLSS
jgi:hypothetical protein